MAASNTFLTEDHLQCSICLEIFTKPVSTPCGHNYCMVCINKHWDCSQKYNCPSCKKEFSKRPDLCVNSFISNLAAQFKDSMIEQSSPHINPLHSAQGNVLCDVCTDPSQKATKSCLDCGISLCGTHLEPHKIAARLKQHKLITAVKNLEDYICQRHQRPMELFCRNDQMCVCKFCTEGEHKSHNTVPIEEESAEKKTKMQKTQAEVQMMIQDRQKMLEEVRHAVALKKKAIDKEKEDSAEIFRSLMITIKKMQAVNLMALEEKQKDIEKHAEAFVKALEDEIAELKRSDNEMEKLLHSEDHLHFLQVSLTLTTPTPTNNWDLMQINSGLSVENVRRELLYVQQCLNKATDKISGSVTLDYQKEEITRLLKTKLQKGDTWYLIDSGWFSKWKKYVGFDSWNVWSVGDQVVYPGPVDNSVLLTYSLSLKDRLCEELDYNLLPEEAWDKVISWYGLSEHQKPIARKAVECSKFEKQSMVEVYLTELILCEFSSMDQRISLHLSIADTVECIQKEMHKIFKIPDGKETRLWIVYEGNTYERLGSLGCSIQDAGLGKGNVVVIEQRNKDGAWPVDTVAPPCQKFQK